MVKLHIKLLIWINFIFICRAARKIVDITPTSGLDLDDNYIIKIFTHNRSNTRYFENLTIAFKDTEEIFHINSEADSHLSGLFLYQIYYFYKLVIVLRHRTSI